MAIVEKIICDICKEREVHKRRSFKRCQFDGHRNESEEVRLDVCDTCETRIMELAYEANEFLGREAICVTEAMVDFMVVYEMKKVGMLT